MKYIDADHLKVEIESLEENARKIRVAKESTTNEKIGADGQVNLCQRLYLLIDSLQQEQLSTSLCGRVSNDGEYPPGLILGSEQLQSCLKRFPDDTYVDIFITARRKANEY